MTENDWLKAIGHHGKYADELPNEADDAVLNDMYDRGLVGSEVSNHSDYIFLTHAGHMALKQILG